MIKIACVYKTGGVYNLDYVERLRNQCKRNMTIPFQFVCLSDNTRTKRLSGVQYLPLKYGWEGRFSMQEIYAVTGKVMTLGLDTVLTGDITEYALLTERLAEDQFVLHRPFNDLNRKRGQWADGLMCWNGDWSHISEAYVDAHGTYILEQQHTSALLQKTGVDIVDADAHVLGGIVSYKKHCKTGVPENARIVCFHGEPKPHQLSDVEWVQEGWR